MSIDMMKQAATVSLTKQMVKSQEAGNEPGEIEVQVEMYIDTSTSMSERYRHHRKISGVVPSEMQVTIERNLALTLTGLDADGVIPLFTFDSGVRGITEVTETNYKNVLDDWLKKNSLVPDTRFMPIIQHVQKSDVSPEQAKDEIPHLVIVHTDGIPADKAEFLKAVAADASYPRFWIFIGHGQSLDFLRTLDTMEGRVVDNVALVEVDDARGLQDEEYYDKLTEELITSWFPAARKAGITNK